MIRVQGVRYFFAGARVTAYRADGSDYAPRGSELAAAHVANERYFEAYGYACAMQDAGQAPRGTDAAIAFGESFAARAFERSAEISSETLPPVCDAYREFTATIFKCGTRFYTVTLRDGDGSQLAAGQTVTDHHGAEITIHGVTRGPEYNGTAKVDVTIVNDPQRPEHAGFRHDFYDHALGLAVTPIES